MSNVWTFYFPYSFIIENQNFIAPFVIFVIKIINKNFFGRSRQPLSTLEELIEEADSIEAFLPSKVAIKEAMKKAKEWISKVETVMVILYMLFFLFSNLILVFPGVTFFKVG